MLSTPPRTSVPTSPTGAISNTCSLGWQGGGGSEKLLHVAQSLFHDHVPANALGLASAWIDRRHNQPGHGATAPPAADVHYDFHFTSLHALVEAHRAEQ